jgi:hypothetical protein
MFYIDLSRTATQHSLHKLFNLTCSQISSYLVSNFEGKPVREILRHSLIPLRFAVSLTAGTSRLEFLYLIVANGETQHSPKPCLSTTFI